MYRFWRHPKTFNEMRQYYATIDNDLGIKIKVRGKRKPNLLPNTWDEINRTLERSWKKHRKTQYKM